MRGLQIMVRVEHRLSARTGAKPGPLSRSVKVVEVPPSRMGGQATTPAVSVSGWTLSTLQVGPFTLTTMETSSESPLP